MVAPIKEEAGNISDDSYNALIVILSFNPEGTKFPNLRQRLSDVLREI